MTSRRSFLVNLGSVSAVAAFNGCRFCCGDGFDDNLTVFISDCHVQGKGHQLGFLAKTVADILAMRPLPRRVVCFGDLAFLRGPLEDYQASFPALRRLADAGIELTFGMGNHDRRVEFLKVWPEYSKRLLMKDRIVSETNLGGCDLVMLDTLHELDTTASVKELQRGWITPGQLKGAQMEWLEAEMKRRTRPFFLGAHHPVDEIPDGDWKAIAELVKATPLCLGWIHGHNHRWQLRKIGDKPMLGLPSTGHWGELGHMIVRTAPNSIRFDLVLRDYYEGNATKSSPRAAEVLAKRANTSYTINW